MEPKKATSVNPLIPSIPRILLYIGISMLLTILVGYRTILTWLGGDALEKVGGYGFLAQYQNNTLDGIFDIPILGTIVVALFWAGIGSLMYCLFWGLSNTIGEAKKYEEVAVDSVNPKDFSSSKFWQSSGANFALLAASVISLLLLSVSLFVYGFPTLQDLLVKMLTELPGLGGWVSILIFVVLSVLYWHALYFAFHVFNYSRKVVFF